MDQRTFALAGQIEGFRRRFSALQGSYRLATSRWRDRPTDAARAAMGAVAGEIDALLAETRTALGIDALPARSAGAREGAGEPAGGADPGRSEPVVIYLADRARRAYGLEGSSDS